MNKTDLFEAKFKTSPMENYFDDYTGMADIDVKSREFASDQE